MTLPQAPAALAALVIVVVDGSFVPAAPPPEVRAGRVIVPVSLVSRLADRIEVGANGTLTASRGPRRCSARAVALNDPPFVEIAPLVRCLGATHVAFDVRTKTLAVTFERVTTVVTPTPFDPSAPQAVPTTIFTPEPAPPTPRVIVTGSPRPRRTAIPLTVPPSPAATGQRPRSP